MLSQRFNIVHWQVPAAKSKFKYPYYSGLKAFLYQTSWIADDRWTNSLPGVRWTKPGSFDSLDWHTNPITKSLFCSANSTEPVNRKQQLKWIICLLYRRINSWTDDLTISQESHVYKDNNNNNSNKTAGNERGICRHTEWPNRSHGESCNPATYTARVHMAATDFFRVFLQTKKWATRIV